MIWIEALTGLIKRKPWFLPPISCGFQSIFPPSSSRNMVVFRFVPSVCYPLVNQQLAMESNEEFTGWNHQSVWFVNGENKWWSQRCYDYIIQYYMFTIIVMVENRWLNQSRNQSHGRFMEFLSINSSETDLVRSYTPIHNINFHITEPSPPPIFPSPWPVRPGHNGKCRHPQVADH